MCIFVELHWGRSATNRATLSSLFGPQIQTYPFVDSLLTVSWQVELQLVYLWFDECVPCWVFYL